ncbi:TIGR01777 family protein, partial [Candidatus Marinamargulisbacteria bacterium SCGC AAA071-K20]
MKILVTGGSGFIGQALISKLTHEGHQLVLVSRNLSKLKKKYGNIHECHLWDALTGSPPKEIFSGVEGIVNLMGEGVANKRWTKKQKQKIKQSRVQGTQNLMDGAKEHAKKLRVVVSASAIGYYDHLQEATLDEESPASQGFLGNLCQNWESATKTISKNASVRMVILRIGVVFGQGGGALSKMIPPFSLGMGGQIGSGKQWMNWIHLEDLASLIATSIKNEKYTGIYNAVSPENIQNKQFTR